MMELALRNPTIPSKLVVIDMSPIRIKLSTEYNTHVQAMREINAAQLKRQKEADLILQKYEPDLVVRQFLLTNLKKNLNKDGIYEFRIPYEILGRNISNMGDFLQSEAKLKYNRKTLFLTGGQSPYRKQFLRYPELIHAQFPNSRVANIEGAGHWCKSISNLDYGNSGLIWVFFCSTN
jgi:pimeloyl-ACP methyl ester carboxylesterase